MSEKELFRNKLYVSSPTSISIGNCTWFALDTKLVGRVEAMIEENQQLKQKYENAVADYESEKSKNQRAIKIIEDNYYSKNTTDIDSIVVSSNKFIQVRKILKGDNNE